MNSIAFMKPRTAPSDESRALKNAFEASGLSQATVAEFNHVTAGAVRQWIEGERPVPPERAERLAKQLGVDPRRISRRYAATHPWNRNGDGASALSTADDIEALQYVLSALVISAVRHRPVEAEAVRAGLLKEVPLRLQERGFVKELLVTLAGNGRPQAR